MPHILKGAFFFRKNYVQKFNKDIHLDQCSHIKAYMSFRVHCHHNYTSQLSISDYRKRKGTEVRQGGNCPPMAGLACSVVPLFGASEKKLILKLHYHLPSPTFICPSGLLPVANVGLRHCRPFIILATTLLSFVTLRRGSCDCDECC